MKHSRKVGVIENALFCNIVECGLIAVKQKGGEVKVASLAKSIAAFSWSFMALVSIAVGWSFIEGNPSVSYSGESVNNQLAVGYIVAGIILLSEAALTLFRKKLALILSIPVAFFAAITGFDELHQLIQGNMVTSKYLIMYGFVFLISILTIAVVGTSSSGADPINA